MCGAAPTTLSFAGINVAKEAIIQGRITHEGEPLVGAYVRLEDADAEFVAEVPTSVTGHYRFFTHPGEWTIKVLAPSAEPVEQTVTSRRGDVVLRDIEV